MTDTLFSETATREPLTPVEIRHFRDHSFEKREKRGCAVCEKGKTDVRHHGWPSSFNAGGSGAGHAHQFTYQNEKRAWGARFVDLLAESGLPRGLGRVLVEGEATFPDRRARDQGNYRFPLEKFFGDALTDGGWLEDDDWARYEFGGLSYRYEKGVAGLRLMVFASWPEDPAPER